MLLGEMAYTKAGAGKLQNEPRTSFYIRKQGGAEKMMRHVKSTSEPSLKSLHLSIKINQDYS